jgi:6-pyruvoyltetrahydropterin/6-carboxytetrahydropterin synthase
MISVCRRFEFHAAHHLPNYDGPCGNVHGHSYILEVEVMRGNPPLGIADPVNEKGMVIDFSVLKKIVDENIGCLMDHKDLNMIWENPTAENMVESIATILRPRLPEFTVLTRVRLYETSNSFAEWRSL